MSYSYIKSVFPNYETSNVYDENVYNNIQTSKLRDSDSSLTSTPSAFDDEQLSKFAHSLISSMKGAPDEIKPATTKLLEQYSNEIDSKDNLHFYNIPRIPQAIHNKQEGTSTKEEFQNEELTCDVYMKHVLECNKCREVLLKQLNIETDRQRNEEMMEVVSYVVFGLFVLMLLDALKK